MRAYLHGSIPGYMPVNVSFCTTDVNQLLFKQRFQFGKAFFADGSRHLFARWDVLFKCLCGDRHFCFARIKGGHQGVQVVGGIQVIVFFAQHAMNHPPIDQRLTLRGFGHEGVGQACALGLQHDLGKRHIG